MDTKEEIQINLSFNRYLSPEIKIVCTPEMAEGLDLPHMIDILMNYVVGHIAKFKSLNRLTLVKK